MSCVVAFLTHARALLGVDSEAVGADGERVHFNKLVVLPGARAALTAIPADGAFLTAIAGSTLFITPDFDDLVAKLPALARQAVSTFEELARQGVMPALRDSTQVVVAVGWSARLGRAAGYTFESPTFAAEEIGMVHAFPWASGLDRLPPPSNFPNAVRYLAGQVELVRRECPTGAAGGPFVVVEIREDGTTVRASTPPLVSLSVEPCILGSGAA